MLLTEIRLSNIRGFLDQSAETHLKLPGKPGWHVVAGRNGSGKTTFLRAVALALSGPEFARQLMPSFRGWLRDGATSASVSVDVKHSAGDDFRGMGKLPSSPIHATLRWTRLEEGPELALAATPVRQKKLVGPWRGPWGENPEGWLVVGYGPFRRLTGHASDAQKAMVGPHHQRRLVSLFREDASLLEAVGWLQDLRFRALEKRDGAEELLANVVALLNDGLLPDGALVDRVDSDGLWVVRAGSTVELRELSDGYRVALAIVIDIIRHVHEAFGTLALTKSSGVLKVAQGGVVLIDEVDAHLHVSWQQRIGFWLTERFPQMQFLVTTHSPFPCQAVCDNGLFLLPSPGEARGIEPADADTFRRVVNGGADDAVLSKLFGLDSPRSARAERLRDEWSKLRAKQLRKGLSKDERKRFADVTSQLPLDFDVPAAE